MVVFAFIVSNLLSYWVPHHFLLGPGRFPCGKTLCPVAQDACGVGFVGELDRQPSRKCVTDALEMMLRSLQLTADDDA